jgi:hypothetical protein
MLRPRLPRARRPRPRLARISPLVAGVLFALVAAIALSARHHEPRPLVPRSVAIRDALQSPMTKSVLAGAHWDRITVNSLDDQLEHISFFNGGQLEVEVALNRGGTVVSGIDDRRMPVPYGDWIAFQPAFLVGLCALFLLMAGVTPWRRLRNLDVVAALSLVVPIVLFEHRYLDASVLSAVPGLAYLMLRCALRALGSAREPAPSRPLLAAITPGMDAARRVPWLRAALVVFAMVCVSSFDAVDVLYAVMEGATTLVHGVLPYGHMPPGIIHGDTYPILSYVLYVPLALVAPVTSEWDSVDLGLAVTALAALCAAWAVFRLVAGARPARARRPAEDEEAGLRAALAWLAFPPLLVTASTGTTDVLLAAMLAVAVLLWRRPTLCAGTLAIAGWFKLGPLALLPVSLAPLRGRHLARALAAIVLVSLPMLGVLIALGGLHGPAAMLHAMSYQFSRGSLQSVWSVLGIEWLQPLGQACVLGLIVGAALRLRRDAVLAADRLRMAALTAAIMIGLQFAADYWAFLYLVWFAPLVGLSLLADVPAAAHAAARTAAVPGGLLEPAPAIGG